MTICSRWRGVAVATAVLLAGTLSACGSNASGKSTLEFQTSQAIDSPLYAALKKVTAAFEKQNPDIKIDLKPGDDNYEANMKVRLAARNPPDIWATHGWSLLRYSDFLAPLDKEPWAKNFNQVLAPAMKNKKGQFFALPVTTAASGLIVDKTVLGKVGIDPASLTTWSAFEAAAAKIKAANIVPVQMAGSKDGSAGNLIDWLAPGAFSDQELSGFGAGKFQGAAYQKLLQVVADLKANGYTNKDYTAATYDDMARALAQDKAAFAFNSNALINSAWQYNPNADLTYIPVPAINGDPAYLVGGEDTAFGVAKDGSHLADAKKYLAFLAQPDNIAAVAKSVGNPPGLVNATTDLGKLNAPYEQYVKSGSITLKPFFDRVYLPNGMWSTVVSTADAVVAGQSSPAQGTDKMSGDFATLYKQSQ